jgi:hypothetical protein
LLYILQEILVVLFLLAVLTVTILVFAIALILIQGGVRRAALSPKTGVGHLASLSRLLNFVLRKGFEDPKSLGVEETSLSSHSRVS